MPTTPYFQTNQITLYHGDCLEVMPRLEDQSFDMVLCDLPYAVTQNHWDVVIPFEPLWEQYKRLIKPNGAIVLFGSQPFTSELVMSNRKWFKYCWVWEKTKITGVLNASHQPVKQHEDIAVFCEGKTVYNPQNLIPFKKTTRQGGCSKNYGKRNTDGYLQQFTNHPRSILSVPSEGSTEHPTQKPVSLLSYLIKTYTNEGDRILDNCAGSGSTLVAARDTGRYAVGIEKEEKYCKIAADRCSQLSIFESILA